MAKILVCDDSPLLRKMITDILTGAGHKVIGEAANGNEAYKKFLSLKPDIITMDILMEPDGHQAIKRIIKEFPKAKIIVITGLTDGQGEVAETVRLGGKGFVSKPIEANKLLFEVAKVINSGQKE